jgi:hypothetical protein
MSDWYEPTAFEPTMSFGWKRTWTEIPSKPVRSEELTLVQLWRNDNGQEEWRPIPILPDAPQA